MQEHTQNPNPRALLSLSLFVLITLCANTQITGIYSSGTRGCFHQQVHPGATSSPFFKHLTPRRGGCPLDLSAEFLTGVNENNTLHSISSWTQLLLATMSSQCYVISSAGAWMLPLKPSLVQHSVPCMGTEQGGSFPAGLPVQTNCFKANIAHA